MSMGIGKTYMHEGSGATFVCLSAENDTYTGEMTDSRGTRRWVLSGAEHGEWKPVEPVAAAPAFVSAFTTSNVAPVLQAQIINNGGGKVTKKK